MAVTYFPFNSIVTDGVPDRPANAENLSAYLAGFFGNGVLMQEETALQVKSGNNDMDVKIYAGAGCINGKIILSDAVETLTLEASSATMGRFDRVIFRLDDTNRLMEFDVLTGTPASDPVPPELTRDSGIYEMCLATVYVPKGAEMLVDRNITDTRRDADLCGIPLVVPHMQEIENGGTGADNAPDARQNINFLGVNPVTEISEDNYEAWAALGTGFAYMDQTEYTGSNWLFVATDDPASKGFILNMVYDDTVYQTFFGKERIWVRRLTSSSDETYGTGWLPFSNVYDAAVEDTGWVDATKSTNVNSDAIIKYRQIGNVVYVKVNSCTTQLALTPSNYSNAKLVGYNLPAPAVYQFFSGMVDDKAALFYVGIDSDTDSKGRLRFFTNSSDQIAAGANIRTAFSYLVD